MDKRKMLLYLQSALCILWVILMGAAAIRIYTTGLAYQAQGHPEAWIYTREKAVEVIGRYLPILLLPVISNIVCVFLGVRDEDQDKPVRDPDLMENNKKERENPSGSGNGEERARKLKTAKIAVFAVAVVFVIAGIMNGSMEDMLIKAVNICTECIGLG